MRYCKILFIIFFVNLLQHSLYAITDTVPDYWGIRLYAGNADTIYVDHERYYGTFVKDTCTNEDHGTTISNFSNCWKRIFQNYSPRFWEIGGQSPHNSIGTVMEEVDAINSAAFAAWYAGGDTIEIDSLYDIDRQIYLLNNNTYLGTTDSAGFRRIDPPKTVLTDTAHFGDNKLLVESNAGFRTYQKINIANGQGYDSIAKHVSYTASVSHQFGGDSIIFLSGRKIQKQMLPGDTVSLFFPMMKGISIATADSILLKNLVFDGNRKNYSLSFDWRVNSTMLFPTNTGSLIENCRFYNIPAENVVLCGTDMIDCSGRDFNGSAIHFSCSPNDNYTNILYNNFKNLNAVGDAQMEHSEAGFTFSAKVRKFRMAYNRVSNIQESGIGLFGNDDTSNVITDNLLESVKATIGYIPFYKYDSTNTIYNNKNLNYTDTSTSNCMIQSLNLRDSLPCKASSSIGEPLKLGDTITIVMDSLLLRNSNENFVKRIAPIYEDDFFTLIHIQLNTPGISQFHSWNFDIIQKSLDFDNGHKNGLLGEGNWGYEPCGQVGGCNDLRFQFRVDQLPDFTEEVGCPLQGISIKYDGELNTWDQPLLCMNEPIQIDTSLLGTPVLKGSICSIDSLAIIACDSVKYNNEWYFSSQQVVDTLESVDDCDSIIIASLIIHHATITTQPSIIGCDSIKYNGQWYFDTTTLVDSLLATTGCDSIVLTVLEINNSVKIIGDTITAVDSTEYKGVWYSINQIVNDTLIGANNCDSIIQVTLLIDRAITGIPDSKSINKQVRVYPNPATNYLNVEADFEESMEYFIYDLLGNVVLEGYAIQQNKIPVSYLPTGIYIFQFYIRNEPYKVLFAKY